MMDRPADEFDDALPPGLAEGLGQGYGRKLEVPRAIDQAVLGAMREKFAKRRRMRLTIRWSSVASGALAACVAVVIWLSTGSSGIAPHTPVTSAIKGDMDASGRVDMVDALILATRMKRGEMPDAAWDLNGDGKIDQADVEAIAHGAVMLQQGGQANAAQLGAVRSQELPPFEELGVGRISATAPLRSFTPLAIDHKQLHSSPEDQR